MESEDPTYYILAKYTKSLILALGYRDALTRLHSDRVCGLAESIGVCCGLSRRELGILKISALFHDIGKIGVPDHILMKSGPLDEAEWKTIMQHSEIGQHIIAATELKGSLEASLVIRHHHEHYNGNGYPDGLAGENISVYSRIIAIADSYDAMAVTRSYHRARSHSEIMDILRAESGEKHDPQIARILFKLIETSHFKAM